VRETRHCPLQWIVRATLDLMSSLVLLALSIIGATILECFHWVVFFFILFFFLVFFFFFFNNLRVTNELCNITMGSESSEPRRTLWKRPRGQGGICQRATFTGNNTQGVQGNKTLEVYRGGREIQQMKRNVKCGRWRKASSSMAIFKSLIIQFFYYFKYLFKY